MQKIWGSDSSIQTPGALLTWQTQSGTVVTIPNTTIPGSSVGGLPVPTWAITPYTLADVPGFTPGTTLAGFPLPPAGIPIWSPSAPTQGNSVRWGVTGSHVETTVTNQYFDDLIATAVIPWMRSIQITARLKGFRPFTKLFAFFNGISVDAYIQQTKPALGTLGANIVVDDTGAAEAVFTIPSDVNMRFPVGDATLRFTDDPVNGATNAQSFTSGETVFKSGGTLETRQQTTVTTVTQTVVEDWGWVSPPRDPVAQTFYVSDSGGIWVPKIDVAFSTKAKKLPITLQVRSVTAGLPTNVVAAGGQVILDPSQVNVSADGSVMTSFVFDDPIYLAGKTEYAIVLLADTQEYNVFIATMGQRVIGKNLNVAEQPNIGVFLTSSNASTWSPDQLSDLTFAVHKCVFDTNTTTQVVWECFRPMAQITTLHPITTTSGSNIVKLNVRSHSLKAGDTFPIYVAEDGAGIPSTEFIGTKTVLSSGLDWVTFAVTTNANASTNVGGVVSLTANYPVTEFRPDIIQNTLPGTTVAWEYQYVSQASRATSAWTLFTNTNETNGLPSEGVIRQDGDFKIRATFKTTDPNLTPQVKLNGMGVQLIGRRLTNDATNPAFNYVTKAVKFDNANTSMRAYIGVNLPGSTNMKAYYKLLATGSDDLSKVAWTEVLPQTSIINQQKGFVEYEYRVNSTTPFVGYKMMICFFGPDPVDCPIVQDFRSIALA
jgi:hypothetical protein